MLLTIKLLPPTVLLLSLSQTLTNTSQRPTVPSFTPQTLLSLRLPVPPCNLSPREGALGTQSLFRLQLHWALRGNKSLVPTWMLAASVKGTEQNSSANKYTELLRAPGMQMVKMSLS
ncbi:hypothetical protein Pcinc_001596 [Petrolisthes cinctipes]|uniref:Uncharacterized protein n=1 Tax=Petrolisthes cinctipes TaxID=88211 RepID=A0AAE1GR45_PETCI|nr:hypothetical protein Pcinc_001596 [Petrolisthes cinctipes]